MKALIALEDGTILPGTSFTGEGETVGEIVFNTSMSGYQEILTDPSYTAQMVTMTYPLIGNYGVNEEDMESSSVHPGAFVIKEYQGNYSNYRATSSLCDFLKKYGVLGIEEVDTRMLTRIIRSRGAMKAVISTNTDNPNELVQKAKEWHGLEGQNMVSKVTCREPYLWQDNQIKPIRDFYTTTDKKHRVIVYDFGVKYNQLRILDQLGCQVLVVPATTPAKEVLAHNPDGFFLSNGPGDPAGVPEIQDNIKELIGKKPIFGICFGHQLLALACGCTTYKLKFGHRGGNQPIKNIKTAKVDITSHNHGFCVDKDNLPRDIEVTHININDDTLAGIRHKQYPAFSVQYHPEHAPGPHDAEHLFNKFIELMQKNK